ncbi:MAG: VWA domain-containing protein [Sandaracinaceae bacterium]|nr:VWA domain-containing protein [Sandaracinaceae bacterium]
MRRTTFIFAVAACAACTSPSEGRSFNAAPVEAVPGDPGLAEDLPAAAEPMAASDREQEVAEVPAPSVVAPGDGYAARGALGSVQGQSGAAYGGGGAPDHAATPRPMRLGMTSRGRTERSGGPPSPTATPTPRPVSPPATRASAAAPARRPASPAALPAQPAAPLPTSGVLASNFVAGGGAQARLEDLLDRGVMVDGRNVRLEAFDDLGRLPYPVPAREAVGLHAELERGRVLATGERVHLQIALMARQGEAPVRPRMDVRLVLDRSGSMYGDKWTNAIAAAHQLVDRLEAGDTFGLISYSDDANVDLAPARVGDRRAAHAAIDRVRLGGGTNIEAALRAAASVAPRRRAMNDVLLVVLVSDGVANIGQTNAGELGSIARAMFDEHGVLTTSVGLGTDFDEETMLSIAREGSGSYHFVRRAGDIGDILRDELEERAQAVAQALRLRVELGEGVVATRVYGSQVLDERQAQAVRATEIATDRRLARELGIARDRQQDNDRGLRMHLPTFRRGDQHVVLMELEVPPGTSASRIARVSLDYKDLATRENRSASVDVSAERTRDAEAAVASTRRTVKRTVLAFAAGDALAGASSALGRGDVAGAQALLAERRRVLEAGAQLWSDAALARDADLLSRYERVIGSAWDGWDGGARRTMVLAMNFYGERRMR